MDKLNTLKEPKGYAEDFDPGWYLETYLKPVNSVSDHEGVHPFAMKSLHDVFSTGNYSGHTLLDIGTGPTVHSVLSASRHVQEIHLSDINARNRELLQLWLNGTDTCREIFEFICKKEGEGKTIEQRSEEVRKKVTKILEIDLREAEPLKDAKESYDIITSSLVLCSIANTDTEYNDLLKKMVALLKPKGYLVVVDALKGTFYQVGDFIFSSCDIAGETIKGLCLKENLKILEWIETIPGAYSPYYGECVGNEQGCSMMVCQKV